MGSAYADRIRLFGSRAIVSRKRALAAGFVRLPTDLQEAARSALYLGGEWRAAIRAYEARMRLLLGAVRVRHAVQSSVRGLFADDWYVLGYMLAAVDVIHEGGVPPPVRLQWNTLRYCGLHGRAGSDAVRATLMLGGLAGVSGLVGPGG